MEEATYLSKLSLGMMCLIVLRNYKMKLLHNRTEALDTVALSLSLSLSRFSINSSVSFSSFVSDYYLGWPCTRPTIVAADCTERSWVMIPRDIYVLTSFCNRDRSRGTLHTIVHRDSLFLFYLRSIYFVQYCFLISPIYRSNSIKFVSSLTQSINDSTNLYVT